MLMSGPNNYKDKLSYTVICFLLVLLVCESGYGLNSLINSLLYCTILFTQVSIPDRASAEEFIEWMIAEPQTIVWLPTLHRLAVSETGTLICLIYESS